MKLKTLKDLEKYSFSVEGHTCPVCNLGCGGHELNYCDCEGVEIKNLKQEAIKWIKEHDWIYDAENDEGHDLPEELTLTHVDKEFKFICFWIKHFFNITEEDLKE